MSNMNKTYGEVAKLIFDAVNAAEIKPNGKSDIMRVVTRHIESVVKSLFPDAQVITWFRHLDYISKDRYFAIKFSYADTSDGIYFKYEVSLKVADKHRGTNYAIKSIRFKDDYCDLDKTMAELAQEHIDKSIQSAKNKEDDLDKKIAKAETTFETVIEKMKKREPLTWEEAYDIESLLKKYKEMVN